MTALSPEIELEQLLSEDVASASSRERATFDNSVHPFEQRLVLFGAGNLGKKVLGALRQDGIEPLAFTDNAARLWGQTIEGVPVLSPADAAEKYGRNAAFVVTAFSPACNVVAFQKQLHDLGCKQVMPFMALLWKYAEQCLPHVLVDLPHRVLEDRAAVRAGLELFRDDTSRREYVAQVRWRLLQDFVGLPRPSKYEQYFPDDLFSLQPNEVFVDCGAFDGDTVRSILKHRTDFGKIIALEPDPGNYERLLESIAKIPQPLRDRVSAHKVAASSARGTVRFQSDGTDGAKVLPSGGIEVQCDTLDNILVEESPSYVKLDVEGAEADALRGAVRILAQGAAIWAVCVYHKQADLWQLPQLLKSSLPNDYRLFLRKHGGEIFDTVCYAVPHSRLQNAVQ